MKSKFLNLKEFVLVLLLACLETVIGLVVAMPFAANLQLVYFLVPGLTGLINGIIYVLLIKKCPKVGTQFIIPFVYGLLFLFSGSVYVFMFFAILAVANELIMIGGYGKKVRQAIPHVLTWSLNSMGSTLTMLLFRDSMVQTYVKMGMSAVDAEAAVSSVEGFWLAPQNIAIAQAALLFNEAIESLEEGYADTAFRENELAQYYREAESFLEQCGARKAARPADNTRGQSKAAKPAARTGSRTSGGKASNNSRTAARKRSAPARRGPKKKRTGNRTILTLLLVVLVLGLLLRALHMGVL